MSVPQLRFKDKSGKDFPSWEIKLISTVAEVTTGNKDTQNKVEDGTYPFFVRSQTVEKINSYSFDGEAILTSGDGVGVGKNFHYINGKFDFHQRVYCIHSFKNKINGKFIFHYFSEKFNKRVMQLSAKNSVDSVRRSMITDMPISTPPSFVEQTKIANFLTAVDEKIAQLTQKCDLLTQYKKSVMQQIFSQEIRFKDDDGRDFSDWEEKQLGNIAEVIMGQSPDSNSYNEAANGIPLIQGNADILNRKTNPRIWTSEPTKLCRVNDIILTVRAPVGAVAMSHHDACIGRGVCVIRTNKKTHIDFIYQMLLWFEPKRWVSLEQGSTFTAVSGKDIKTIEFYLPCFEEQTKIANYLTAIDEKITNTQAQLAAAKQYKQGLLQQMFI
jgi:type I restriction enzyme, S subunit